MDIEKFRSAQSRGNFSDEPDGYAPWSKWAGRITAGLAALEREHAFLSSGIPPERLQPLVDLCAENPESAIHVLVRDMTHEGASWGHMSMLRRVSDLVDGGFPDMAGIEGRYYAQIVRAMAWYDRLEGDYEAEVRLETGFVRCSARACRMSGGMEIERYGDGLRVLLLDDGPDKGDAVYLDRDAAVRFQEGLAAMVATVARSRKSFFLGTGESGEDRTGLIVSPSNMGEPYETTVRFSVVSPEYVTHASVDVEERDAADLSRAMDKMMGASPAVAPRGPRR